MAQQMLLVGQRKRATDNGIYHRKIQFGFSPPSVPIFSKQKKLSKISPDFNPFFA